MKKNKNKCLLFKTSNLEYIKTINNVELGKIVYSDDYHILKYKSKKTKKGEKNKDKETKAEEKIIKQNKCVLAYHIRIIKN